MQNAERTLLTRQESENETTQNAQYYEELGDRYLRGGDINRAYVQYVKGLGIEPDNSSLLHKQAELLLGKSQFEQAERIYEKLLEMDPDDSRAYEGLGRIFFGMGSLEKAEELFQHALGLDNRLWKSREFLGLIHCSRKEYEQAIKLYQQALEVNPDDDTLINNLAVTQYITGNYKKAAELFEKIAGRSKNPKIFNNLAMSCFQLGRYGEALEWFKRGAEQEAVAYNNMGYSFLLNKQYQNAVKSFEKAIELFPKYYPSAQHNLKIAQNALILDSSEGRK